VYHNNCHISTGIHRKIQDVSLVSAVPSAISNTKIYLWRSIKNDIISSRRKEKLCVIAGGSLYEYE